MLDVGCGAGRMAIPLMGYLNEKGSYEGFDPVVEHVRWYLEHIESRHPNFRFRYLAEVARVSAPGAKSFITWFLIDDDAERRISDRISPTRFGRDLGGFRVVDPNVPESAVAYCEEAARALYVRNGLKIAEPIRWGQWSVRPDGLSFQDIVIAIRC